MQTRHCQLGQCRSSLLMAWRSARIGRIPRKTTDRLLLWTKAKGAADMARGRPGETGPRSN